MLGGSSEDAINDDERKFNADVSHDMLMVRKERKEFLLAQIEKKRAEQEKLDKKRNKKWFWILGGKNFGMNRYCKSIERGQTGIMRDHVALVCF